MRLTKLILIPLMLCSFSLTSCKQKYSLKVTGEVDLIIKGPYLANAINKRTRHSFNEGDLVIFKTGYVYDADVVARLNGVKIDYFDYEDGLSYKFYMPAQNSELNISIEGGI